MSLIFDLKKNEPIRKKLKTKLFCYSEDKKNTSKDGPELNETEEAIKNYLEKDEALPYEILDTVIGCLWTNEPYK
jgi:hypothetical protein